MKKYPKVSIVIPLYKKTPAFYEAVDKCLGLDYPNFEILIGVDKEIKVPLRDSKIFLVRTKEKRTGPAEKRDLAIKKAKGEYVAFLDDDSYPNSDWLSQAIKFLKKMKVQVVCGPGLTPPGNSFSQQITGAVLGSYFGSGPFYYRFNKGVPKYVDDYPAYNMIISRKILNEIGGFGTKFYGGEDTALCLKIVEKGHKIYYHPEIVVYHHRRSFPFGYMRQVGNVGLHRGYFVKKYPKTSVRLIYFMPILLLALSTGLMAFVLFFPKHLLLAIYILIGVYLIIFFEGFLKNPWYVNIVLPIVVCVSHVVYGAKFVQGVFFTKELKR